MKNTTVFMIENDGDMRTSLRKMLKNIGYTVQLAIDEEDAFQRVFGGHLKADVILVSLTGKSVEETLKFGREIRLEGNLTAPLVVLPKNYKEEMENKIIESGENDYCVYLGEGQILFGLLSMLAIAE